MQRRDSVILKKILSEIQIAFEMLGDTDLDSFLSDEMLKRAVGMTVINIGELVKNITEDSHLSPVPGPCGIFNPSKLNL